MPDFNYALQRNAHLIVSAKKDPTPSELIVHRNLDVMPLTGTEEPRPPTPMAQNAQRYNRQMQEQLEAELLARDIQATLDLRANQERTAQMQAISRDEAAALRDEARRFRDEANAAANRLRVLTTMHSTPASKPVRKSNITPPETGRVIDLGD